MTTLSNTYGFFGPSAGTALHYDFSDIAWSQSGTVSSNPNIDIEVAGGGLDIEASYEVSIGLTGAAHLDLGSMTSEMEFDGQTALVNGTGETLARFDTTRLKISQYDVEATGPDAAESYFELGISASAKVDALVEAYAWYDAVIDEGETRGTIVDGTLFDFSLEQTLIPRTTLDVIGGLDGNILTVALGEYFEAKIDLPEFEYDPTEATEAGYKPDDLTISGMSTPFATLEFGLASFLGMGPYGESLELGFIEAGIEAGLMDVKLVAEASIAQEITIEADLEFSMTTTLDDTVYEGKMGDEIVFETPEGEGSFDVTIDYTLVQTVYSTMSLVLNTAIDWKVLFGQVFVGIPDISEKWEFEIALLEDRIDLGELLGLTVDFELSNDVSVYESDAGQETFTVWYEKFITAAAGKLMQLTTHQITAIGGEIANRMVGNDNENVMHGAGGDDTLQGSAGQDELHGGAGNDRVFGGVGRDMVAFDDATAAVQIDLAQRMAVGEGDDTLTSIENARGSDHDDLLSGTDGKNFLSGGEGADTIRGLNGDDRLNGGGGSDILDGGDGVDTLGFAGSIMGVTVDMVLNTAQVGGDTDFFMNIEVVNGSEHNDHITGNGADNTLRGGVGDDSLFGGAGDDLFVGGAGADQFDGGEGMNTVSYAGSAEGVSVYLNFPDEPGIFSDAAGDRFLNIQNLIGSDFNDSLRGNDQTNALYGADGGDYLQGFDGTDLVFGGAGNDDLYGDEFLNSDFGGDDTLDGGEGDDYLDGGLGNDVFVFSSGADTLVGGAGDDVLTINGMTADFETGLYYDQNADTYRRYVEDQAGNVTYFGSSLETLQFIDQSISTASLFN